MYTLLVFPPAVKDVNVLLERERSEGISSPSRDDDSTLLNPGTHSSILEDNTKSESGLPEVSGGSTDLHLTTLSPTEHIGQFWTGIVWMSFPDK